MVKKGKCLILLLICMLLIGCNSQKVNTDTTYTYKEKEQTLSIITTNEILKNCLYEIIGEKHVVESIFSNNNKIDEFNFSNDAIKNISKEDMFFYLGGEYEPWVENLISKLERKNLTLVNLSRGIKSIESSDKKTNPYYFISINNYKTMLLNIKNSIEESDTKNKDLYEGNFIEAMKRIDIINKKNEELQNKIKDTVIITANCKADYIFDDLKKTIIKMPNAEQEKNIQTYQNTVNIIKTSVVGKKALFIYETDEELKKYDSLIKENSLIPLKFIYNNNNNIEEIVNQNLTSLEKIMNN